jgi:hypothetical protein
MFGRRQPEPADAGADRLRQPLLGAGHEDGDADGDDADERGVLFAADDDLDDSDSALDSRDTPAERPHVRFEEVRPPPLRSTAASREAGTSSARHPTRYTLSRL